MPQGGDVDEYLRAKSRPLPSFPSRPNILHFTAETTARWRKLERPKIFESLRMPVADVFVVGGEKWCTSESRRHVMAELAEMCQICPIVIRCDVSQDANLRGSNKTYPELVSS
jgi:hypothetical protein